MLAPDAPLLFAVRECALGRALGRAWALIDRGVEVEWFRDRELAELITALSKGHDYGVEELLFDPHRTPGMTRVSLLDDADDCSTEALLAALREVQRRLSTGD